MWPHPFIFVFKSSEVFIKFYGAFRSFSKNLKNMPRSRCHNVVNLDNIFERNTFMKKIAHGIDKNPLRVFPAQRLCQLVRVQLHIGKLPLPPKSLRIPFRVAIQATRRNLGTPRHRIPNLVRPFNLRPRHSATSSSAHCSPSSPSSPRPPSSPSFHDSLRSPRSTSSPRSPSSP